MKKRFSAEELHELRNDIPIGALITDVLLIPSKTSDGFFRFLCPKCHEFQTSVKHTTNLARCFRCERNFNTIEIMMAAKDVGFIESVTCLKEVLQRSKTFSQLFTGAK